MSEKEDLWFDSDEAEEDYSKFFTTYKQSTEVKKNKPKLKIKNKSKDSLETDNTLIFSNNRGNFSIPKSDNNLNFKNLFENSNKDEIYPLGYSPEITQELKSQTVTNTSNNSIINNIINTARLYVGGKYISGGHKPSNGGFDCSGLLYYVFNENGVKLPRATYDIFEFGETVNSLSDVKPGDIICTPGSGYTKKHVKMVSKIVDGQIYVIEAKGRKYGIVESPLKKTNNIITIRRVVPGVKSSKKGGKLILKAKSGYKINDLNQQALLALKAVNQSVPGYLNFKIREQNRKIAEDIEKENNTLVTVRVPSAGGGFTNTQITRKQLKDYYNKIGKNPEGIIIHTVVDPTIIAKAKLEHPEKFADPINNVLNWSILGALTGGVGLANGAVKNTGNAIVSTIPKLSFSSAYQTGIGLAARPTLGALWGDTALGAVTTIPSIIDMTNNGINFSNATEAVLGTFPIYNQVYNSAKNGIGFITNKANQAKFINELNNSIKNTKLKNMDIEIVSPSGITEGSTLNSYSTSDVGTHFFPRWSTTSNSILSNNPNTFIRTGVHTTSDNIPYVIAEDTGNWSSWANPQLYSGLDAGNTPFENLLALKNKGVNYQYINNFEGNGNVSYFTPNPEFGLILSKNKNNIHYSRPLNTNNITFAESQYVNKLNKLSGTNILQGYIGDNIITLDPKTFNISILNLKNLLTSSIKLNSQQEYLNYLKKLHNNYVDSLPDLEKELYLKSNVARDLDLDIVTITNPNDPVSTAFKNKTLELIDDFYTSPEYLDRFINSFANNPNALNLYNDFIYGLNDLLNNYMAGYFNHPLTRGITIDQNSKNPIILALNTNTPLYNTNMTLHHEFGHGMYDLKNNKAIKELIKFNNNLIGDPFDYLTDFGKISYTNYPKDYEYLLDVNELRQRIIPSIYEALINGWTPEQTLANSKYLLEFDLNKVLDKNYLIKLIGGLLTTTPIIINKNNN